MTTLLIPACGLSTRFPNVRPKFLLTHPDGKPMLLKAIEGFNLTSFDYVYIVVQKHHEEEYCFIDKIREMCGAIDFIVLDSQTDNQPMTVAEAIKKQKITGQVVIKDCDNYFKYNNIPEDNFIGTYKLDNLESTNPKNKSYVLLDENKYVTNIVEKKIISNVFCCGTYGFKDVDQYLKYYEILKHNKALYISDIIWKMLLDGITFTGIECKNYLDWGTLDDWMKYKSKFKTLFIDLDGTLVKSSAQYMKPYTGTTTGITPNIDHINKLYNNGFTQIIITTARPDTLRKETIEQLEKCNIKYHHILFSMLSAKRIVINDYAPTNPYKSCEAINIERNSSNLKNFFRDNYNE